MAMCLNHLSEHCHYVILHHNQELANKVVLQFEDIIREKNGEFPWIIMESRNIIVNTLLNLTNICKHSCQLITEMMNPPLIIGQKNSNLVLIFENQFISFDCQSMINYGLKNFSKKNWFENSVTGDNYSLPMRSSRHPTCFIQLFDKFEASILVESSKEEAAARARNVARSDELDDENDNENGYSSENDSDTTLSTVSSSEDENDNEDENENEEYNDECQNGQSNDQFLQTYRFVTRFFASVFDNSQHIHLFVSGNKDSQIGIDSDIMETRHWKLSILDKVFNEYMNNIGTNFGISDYVLLNLASFCVLRLKSKNGVSSQKCLFHVLSKLLAVIHKKQKPMRWGTIVNKTRMKSRLVREIQLLTKESKEDFELLFEHILKSSHHSAASQMFRTSYV